MSKYQLFLVMLNWRSKIFRNFLVYRVSWTLNFSEGVSRHQLFLVTLNFLEFFHLQSTLDSELFRGGVWAATFFGHATFEVKIFRIFWFTEHSGLSIFERMCVGSNFFWSHSIFWNFFIYRALWTLNFSEGVSGH